MRRILTAVLLLGGLVHAASSSPSGATILVSLRGTGGLHIEGTTHELSLSEQDGKLVFQVPLSGVDTGIALRNRHMRNYLDVAHFPHAELQVPRWTLTFPASGTVTESDVSGVLAIHGVYRPCSAHYRAERAPSGELRVRATTRVDMRDFGIDVPSYLGVHVDPEVRLQVDFTLHDL